MSRAVKELSKSGHMVQKENGTLSLTEQGLLLAKPIDERRRFFTKRLIAAGVDPETTEQDACNMERAIRAESFPK